MSQVFILQNQTHYFFGKGGDWVDGRDARQLFRTPHKDEAINQRVEITAKDYTQRVHLLACELSDKGQPLLPDDVVLPSPIEAAADAELDSPDADSADASDTPAAASEQEYPQENTQEPASQADLYSPDPLAER